MKRQEDSFRKRQYSEFQPVFGLYISNGVEVCLHNVGVDLFSFFHCAATSNYFHSILFRLLDLKNLHVGRPNFPKNSPKTQFINKLEKIEKVVFDHTSNFVTPDFVESLKYLNKKTNKYEIFHFDSTPTSWSDKVLSLLYESPRLINPSKFSSSNFSSQTKKKRIEFYDLPRFIITFSLDKDSDINGDDKNFDISAFLKSFSQQTSLQSSELQSNKLSSTSNSIVEFNDKNMINIKVRLVKKDDEQFELTFINSKNKEVMFSKTLNIMNNYENILINNKSSLNSTNSELNSANNSSSANDTINDSNSNFSLNDEEIDSIEFFSRFNKKPLPGSLFKFLSEFVITIITDKLKTYLEGSIFSSEEEIAQINKKQNSLKKVFISKKKKEKIEEVQNFLNLRKLFDLIILRKYDDAKKLIKMLPKKSSPFNYYKKFVSYHFLLSSKHINEIKDKLIKLLNILILDTENINNYFDDNINNSSSIYNFNKNDKYNNTEIASYLLMKTVDFFTTMKDPNIKNINDGFSILFLPQWSQFDFEKIGTGELLSVLQSLAIERMAQTLLKIESPRKSAFLLNFIPYIYSVGNNVYNLEINTSLMALSKNSSSSNLTSGSSVFSPLSVNSKKRSSIRSNTVQNNPSSNSKTRFNSLSVHKSDQVNNNSTKANNSMNSNDLSDSNNTDSNKNSLEDSNNKNIGVFIVNEPNEDINFYGHSLMAAVYVNRFLTINENDVSDDGNRQLNDSVNNFFESAEDNKKVHDLREKVFICGENNINLLTKPLFIDFTWKLLMTGSLETVANLLKESNISKFVPLMFLSLFPSMHNEIAMSRVMISFFDVYNRKDTDRELVSKASLPFLQVRNVECIDFGSPKYFGLENVNFFDDAFAFWKRKTQNISFSNHWNDDTKNAEKKIEIICNEPLKFVIDLNCISKEVPICVEDLTIEPILCSTKSQTQSAQQSPYNSRNEDSNDCTQTDENELNNDIDNKDTNDDDNICWYECDSKTVNFNVLTMKDAVGVQKIYLNFKVLKEHEFSIEFVKFVFWGLSNMKIPITFPKIISYGKSPSLKVTCDDIPESLAINEVKRITFIIHNFGSSNAKNVTLVHNAIRDIYIEDKNEEEEQNFAVVNIANDLENDSSIEIKAKIIGRKENKKFHFVFFYRGDENCQLTEWRSFCMSFEVKATKIEKVFTHCMINPRDTTKLLIYADIESSNDRSLCVKNANVQNKIFTNTNLLKVNDQNKLGKDDFELVLQKNEKKSFVFEETDDDKNYSDDTTSGIFDNNKDNIDSFLNTSKMCGKLLYEVEDNSIPCQSFIKNNLYTIKEDFEFQIDAPNSVTLSKKKLFQTISIKLKLRNISGQQIQRLIIEPKEFSKGSCAVWTGKESFLINLVEIDQSIAFNFILIAKRPGIIDIGSSILMQVERKRKSLPFSHFIYIKND